VFYFFSLFILALYGIHKYFLIYLYNKYKNITKNPPQIPAKWPLVCIQLPIYNEKYVVKRLIRSIIKLDYPADKMQIQVLDDSNDNTSQVVSRLVRHLKKRGYWIDHLQRENREGYKAGALSYGLKKSRADYIAVFDADFFPDPDFLKQTIPYLLQENVGMVQTRWGHANRSYSLLTRLQAIFLDAHFTIEHLARNRSGRFFNFNGTAGVWRIQAIQDAGGWHHDTLTEDLDLSYRAQLAGWKFLYLPDVVAMAELPVEMNAYKNQQHRWAKGSVQTIIKLFWQIISANLPFYIKMEAIIHLSNNLAYLLMIIPSVLLIPILNYQINLNWNWLVGVYFVTFIASTLSVVIYYARSIKETQGKLWSEAIYLAPLMALGIALSLNNGRAAIEALVGIKSEFKRTPKYQIVGHKGSWKKKLYRSRSRYQHLFELLAAFYFSYGLAYYLSKGFYISLPFFLLFQFGFLYMGIFSLKSHRSRP
jgi:cellulose synthase/poly-beta-1,6-N-acetylglucosamine synthase-like glycosyltransferase